jgi:hypothetical protein
VVLTQLLSDLRSKNLDTRTKAIEELQTSLKTAVKGAVTEHNSVHSGRATESSSLAGETTLEETQADNLQTELFEELRELGTCNTLGRYAKKEVSSVMAGAVQALTGRPTSLSTMILKQLDADDENSPKQRLIEVSEALSKAITENKAATKAAAQGSAATQKKSPSGATKAKGRLASIPEESEFPASRPTPKPAQPRYKKFADTQAENQALAMQAAQAMQAMQEAQAAQAAQSPINSTAKRPLTSIEIKVQWRQCFREQNFARKLERCAYKKDPTMSAYIAHMRDHMPYSNDFEKSKDELEKVIEGLVAVKPRQDFILGKSRELRSGLKSFSNQASIKASNLDTAMVAIPIPLRAAALSGEYEKESATAQYADNLHDAMATHRRASKREEGQAREQTTPAQMFSDYKKVLVDTVKRPAGKENTSEGTKPVNRPGTSHGS